MKNFHISAEIITITPSSKTKEKTSSPRVIAGEGLKSMIITLGPERTKEIVKLFFQEHDEEWRKKCLDDWKMSIYYFSESLYETLPWEADYFVSSAVKDWIFKMYKADKDLEDAKRILARACSLYFGQDPLFKEAGELCIEYQLLSPSLICRKLKIGFPRACRIVDQLDKNKVGKKGIGARAGEMLMSKEAFQKLFEPARTPLVRPEPNPDILAN
ncbi:MAG: DNA translocase FtsK [Bacteroidota bacterium]